MQLQQENQIAKTSLLRKCGLLAHTSAAFLKNCCTQKIRFLRNRADCVPVLIVQNDVGNRHSPTVIAAAITSQKDKAHLPTHIAVQADRCGLTRDSIVLLEQIRTIDKRRLKRPDGLTRPPVHASGG